MAHPARLVPTNPQPPTRTRAIAGVVVGVATLVTTFALGSGAALAKPHRKPKPKPHPTKPAPAPEPTPPPTTTPTTTPSTTPAGGSAIGPGGSGGAATPTPAPTPAPIPPTGEDTTIGADATDAPDVDALRQEYLKLRDELFASRARAATVASALYSTKVTIHLGYGSGRMYNVRRATVRLDGANVYDDTDGAIANDDAVRFEGYVAPGRHQLTIRVEAVGKDDDRFVSTTETVTALIAPAGKDLVLDARVKDGGDIAYAWKRKENGAYHLAVDLGVKTVARPAATGGSGAGAK